MKKLHSAGGISVKMLLHYIGMYRDSANINLARVKKAAKYFTVGKPGYSSLLFKTHKLNQILLRHMIFQSDLSALSPTSLLHDIQQ